MPETDGWENGSRTARYGLKSGDVLEVCATEVGIVIIPERIKRKMAKARIFELVKKEWAHNRGINSVALERAIDQAVMNARTKNL